MSKGMGPVDPVKLLEANRIVRGSGVNWEESVDKVAVRLVRLAFPLSVD